MEVFALMVILLTFVSLVVGCLVVWKVRGLKRALIAERQEEIEQVLKSVGEVESVGEGKKRASAIAELMKNHNVASLVLPLSYGGRISFRLEPTGIRISRLA